MATAAGCALLLTGCSLRLDDPAPSQAASSGEAIGFSAGSALLLDDAPSSKAAYYDGSSFGVFAFRQNGGYGWSDLATKHWTPNFMFNQEVLYSGGVYTYAPLRYWPDASINTLSFWAYSPYNASAVMYETGSTSTHYSGTSAGLPDVQFTVDGHTDVLYSDVVEDQTHASNSGVVPFEFNHALSLIDVKAENVDPSGRYTVTLESVSFKGLYVTAILGSSSWTWSHHSGMRQDLLVWDEDVVLTAGDPATSLSSVMPLPQNLANDACRLHVAFNVSYLEDPSDPSSQKSYSTTRDVYLSQVFDNAGTAVWSENSHYTLTIQISPDKPIEFTVSWDSWGDDFNYHLSS